MKLILLLFLLIVYTPVYAQNQTTFIYLNGSNTNTEESREDFIKGVNKLHKQIIIQFDKNKTALAYTGEINPKPVPFYWGDLSKKGLEVIEEDFDFMKAISPKPAQYVRKFIALSLHDAIWVSKYQNMHPILDKLNEIVIEEYQKGNKVVLAGYSAGTFIAHEYLFTKMPVIMLKRDERVNVNDKFIEHLAGQNIGSTCADAVFKTELVTYDLTGNFIIEDDFETFKRKAAKLNGYTEKYCAPKGVLAGVINHASPFALFYSGIFTGDYNINDLMAYSYKYIIENNLFWLTVNFSDDPLGFPGAKNVTADEVAKAVGIEIEPNGGFIYDKSDKSSGRTFLFAHLSYYNAVKRFSKMVSAAINEGYSQFYAASGQ